MSNPNKPLSMSERYMQFIHGNAKTDNENTKNLENNDENAKNQENDEYHKLIELSRCCICFEKYTLNTRAPICIPCGHSFCMSCTRKLVHGRLVCCCICRKVTFFGPNQLGKNIQLLDILEKMKLLDPDEKRNPSERSMPARAIEYPDNILEGIDGQDMYKFLDFCFDFMKKYYAEKQEKALASLAMRDIATRNQMPEHVYQMGSCRDHLATTMDLLLTKFEKCIQAMKDAESGTRPQNFVYESNQIFIDFNQLDPFGLQAHADSHIEFMANLSSSTPIGGFRAFEPNESFYDNVSSFEDVSSMNRISHNNGIRFHENNLEYRDFSNDADGFRPGRWEPVSRLFNLPRPRARGRRNNFHN